MYVISDQFMGLKLVFRPILLPQKVYPKYKKKQIIYIIAKPIDPLLHSESKTENKNKLFL